MRHRVKKTKLSVLAGPRRALLRNAVTSLLLYEKMTTTEAKAKAIRPIIERIIRNARVNSVTVRRRIASFVMHPNAVKKAVDVLGPRYKDRSGGYTRIVKTGQRMGDAAKMARIELV